MTRDDRASDIDYRALFHHASDALFLIDNDTGAIREANAAASALYGYTHDELLALSNRDLSAEPEETARATRTPPADPSAPIIIPLRWHRKKDGTVFPVAITARFLTSEGRSMHLADIRDVTERERADEALRESEQRFRALFDLSPDPAVIARLKDSKIVDANQAFCILFGYAAEEAIGMTPVELGLFVDLALRNRLFVQARETGGYINEEVEFRTKTGATFTALTSTRVVALDGEPHLYTTARDISERKRAQAEILSLNADLELRVAERTDELESAVAELESFAYSVSHDLRAPLRALDGYSLIVMEDYGDKLDAEARHDLERIRAGAQTMATLIDGLLELSRLNRGRITREEVDLSAMARGLADGLREDAPERDVEFVIADGLKAIADPDLTRVLLANLLGNAWKFTAKHAHARIEVGSLGDDDLDGDDGDSERVFFVRDDGAGFDMAYAGKLFGPFQRLHSAGEFDGTGVGLATVLRIVRRHGGRVWAEAEVEKGATLFFTLPSPPDASA